ncbi:MULTISPECIES: lytic transglycosylase domain-containing protein [unclassified Sulfitobacter]|uniref:lytic transglycosylase domain-containing protein n=1 Tax=unclassified Sulfitobacter TaxID=196795 RepID=UPI0007C3D280|nr:MULTISPECIES: lytic transglycosylase domain-containing protein [unclassified Sulfitobacter]KZY02199.1 hypothetical protein A3721_04675 [Sulfitobacter sp. HI0023]KZY25797.1 hypothetical protein A3728_00170 [Sulfitobacter sp. HI0040]KZZ62752.1 hypothetical protein A3764_00880 [Sulfitobacter sp. HI0129]
MKLLLAAATFGVVSLPFPAQAEALFGVPGKRMELLAYQIAAVDKRGIVEVAPKQVRARTVAETPLRIAPRPARGPHAATYLATAKRLAARYGIPTAIFLALIQQESGWNRNARSPVGAIGLTQLMPGTARDLKVNPHDPMQNLEGGARYLSTQYKAFGDWRLALAAYNAGPGAVRKYGGVPPYKETMHYVRKILGQ